MRRPALQLVSSREHVGRWQGDDPVFFHRRQIRIGTHLLNWGRIDHGITFRVTRIRSVPAGKARSVDVEVCQHMADTVTLQRVGGTETRVISFAGLSYSAAWRLA